MTKRLPSREQTLFLLCEDIREEKNNKHTFVGVFLGRDIVIEKPPLPNAAIPILCIFLSFQDGVGTFPARFIVYSPEQKMMAEGTLEPITMAPGILTNVILRFAPFRLFVGWYKLVFFLNDTPYEFQFEVKLRTPVPGETVAVAA